jgi:hypothetical protein
LLCEKSTPLICECAAWICYNRAILLKNLQERTSEIAIVKQDFRESARLANDSFELNNLSQVFEVLESKLFTSEHLNRLIGRAESLCLLATIVDKQAAPEAFASIKKYVEAEPNRGGKARVATDSRKNVARNRAGRFSTARI